MADKSATTLPALNAAKHIPAPSRINHGVLRTSLHAAIIDAGDAADTTYEVARIPSHARISKLSKVHATALGTGAAFNLGVESENGAAALVSGGTLVSAGTKEGASAIAVADAGKPLWEIAGFTADPSKELSVILTLTAPGTAGGTAMVDLVYIED
ncbi:hypothetical protein [Celeribacter sp.]|uniref:hypothetical protein n=1 Tax=Celeribacter sp. TaxID=1890673 RepID=UPI003A8ECF52